MKPPSASCYSSVCWYPSPDVAKQLAWPPSSPWEWCQRDGFKLRGNWKADPGAAVWHISSHSQSTYGSMKIRYFKGTEVMSPPQVAIWCFQPKAVRSGSSYKWVPAATHTLSSGHDAFYYFQCQYNQTINEKNLWWANNQVSLCLRNHWSALGSWLRQTQPCGVCLLSRLACSRLVPCCLATATVRVDGSSKVLASLLL